eukprot:TRINITY_DN123450_c0_g1_i1.p1 TRINITY_DN123450_c0_g1~~TRINITY_DN123450_c0_g1_i1.p1  ORF type:complete len:332 (+),score=63.76 TRINITY_DN123450_c0_g1_i1:44-1039(+)
MATASVPQPPPRPTPGRFTGPHSQGTTWDSVVMDVHADGTFMLELWTFREQYRVPPDAEDEFSPVSKGPRATYRVLDEERVMYTGKVSTTMEKALRFRGFSHVHLNQDFVQDADRKIGGVPSWWSLDGQTFFYLSEENAHWKANCLVSSGGDGVRAVMPGRRRAGNGYAHSGPVSALNGAPPGATGLPVGSSAAEDISPAEAVAALQTAGGWFEAIEQEWEPAEVAVREVDTIKLEFHAHEVVIEEKSVRGEDTATGRHVSGPITFHGWCHGGQCAGEVRITLPPMPEHVPEGEVELATGAVDGIQYVPVGHESGYMGDPEVLIIRPSSRI